MGEQNPMNPRAMAIPPPMQAPPPLLPTNNNPGEGEISFGTPENAPAPQFNSVMDPNGNPEQPMIVPPTPMEMNSQMPMDMNNPLPMEQAPMGDRP
jgi:hypothetical protein